MSRAAKTGPLLAVTALLGALAAASGCSAEHLSRSYCQADDECGDGLACAAGTCLPRAAPPPTWDIELSPRSDSAAAFTELVHVSMPAAAFDLTATPKVMLTGTLAFDAGAAPLTSAHVLLAVPAAIPGRPDLQFESDLALMSDTKTPTPTFTVTIPSGTVGRAGTLRLLPAAPDSLTHAASTFALTVAPTLTLAVSAKALTVRGRLFTLFGDALVGLVARAFRDGNLVSNIVKTQDDGSFTLMVPQDADTTPLAIEVESAMDDAPQPHFWANPFAPTANTDLGDIHLPAYSQPSGFRFLLRGDTSSGAAVPGAIVRARTLLGQDTTGTTDFLRDGLTDLSGQAMLNLLPGSTAALLYYDVAIIPPAESIYAATCLHDFPLAAGGLLPTVVLGRRPVVAGAVLGADGKTVSGATVLATRTAPERNTACDGYASTPQVAVTTAADGSFSLHLDAGTYTLDFDPPAGSPYPRVTELGVVVTGPGIPLHDVQLPPGAIVEGTLHDAAGQALPQAGVRFYGPACLPPMTCADAPPVLQAQTHADANGHYRAVIPTATSASR